MSISNNPPDYSARDRNIACQTYSPVRRLDGLPHDLFASYWRDVHGPLCSRLPGLGFYVQHHFSRDHKANLWPKVAGVQTIDFTLDGAVEIGFASTQDMGRFVDASPILFGDEVNLFGWDAAFFLPGGSETFVERQADAVPNGPDRLHRLHVYIHGSLDREFRAWVATFAAQIAGESAVQKLRLHVPEAFDNANPQPPSPVDHHVPDNMAKIAVIEIGFDSALTARQFFESDAFKSTLNGQATYIKATAAYLVTGVYTFVRDRRPTTAGLRGSRVAEVIEKTGAINHLARDVTDLFRRR